MDERARQALIARVTEQVCRELGAVSATPEEPPETIAVISSPLALPGKILDDVREEFGKLVRYLIFGDHLNYPEVLGVRGTPEGEQTYIEQAAAADSLLLLSPKVATLTRIADGEEAGPVEDLALRALLWRKEVHVWLDFLPVRFKRNTFYAKVLDTVEALEDMGVKVSAFDWMADLGKKALPTLVTEQDVLAALEAGETEFICASGAIITPSAKDRAATGNLRIFPADRRA